MKKIYLGSDHAGFYLKEKIKLWLVKNKIAYEDLGNFKYEKKDDYPDYAAKVARKVAKEGNKGILVCGSAEGVCIAANKIKGVRAVNPCDVIKTKFARMHEDANILCLAGGGTRVPQPGTSLIKSGKLIKTFLNTKFSKAKRHQRRLNKIKKLER